MLELLYTQTIISFVNIIIIYKLCIPILVEL